MGRSRPTQRVTLAAVARLAGVAESTASRVMNGYTRNFRVRPEVRQRVIDAARELKYEPNPMVRSIAAKRTNLVAILDSTISEEMQIAVRAAARVLIGHGKHVCAPFIDPDRQSLAAPSWRVDGAIAISPDDPEALSSLSAQGTHCVAIGGESGGCDSVCVDERAGMRLAFERLREGGIGLIAYVGPERSSTGQAGEDRREAYRALCQRCGIMPLVCEQACGSGGDAARILREIGHAGVTSVIASDATAAMCLLQGADELGMRSPDQLSIVCLGDSEMARLATPALTCVRQPMDEIGRAAAGMLLERMGAPDDAPPQEARSKRFAGRVVERQSSPSLLPA